MLASLSASSASTASRTSASNNQALGQSEFLKLLTTQLVNQSPLNPMDNEAFVAQMAQFSTVSGIADMNASLKQLTARFDSGQVATASTYIGKTVLAPGGSIFVPVGQSVNGVLEIPENTGSVQMDITDKSGARVRQLIFNAPPAGMSRFSWDGKDGQGGALPSDTYALSAVANVNGKPVKITPFLHQAVTAVMAPPEGAEPLLHLANGNRVAVSAVTEISR
jgi:flagellar basal-body rod modification protein FlgD